MQKTKNKINGKKIVTLSIIFTLFFTIIIALATGSNPSEEVKSVDIYSDGYEYNEGDSWHLNKSAKWTSKNKVHLSYKLDTIPYETYNVKRIFLVIDTSNSMNGDRLLKLQSNILRFIKKLLTSNQTEARYWIDIAFTDENYLEYIPMSGTCGNDDLNPCYDAYKQKISGMIPSGNLDYESILTLTSENLYGSLPSIARSYYDFYPIVILGDYSNKILNKNQLSNIIGNNNSDNYSTETYNFIQYDMGNEFSDEFLKLPGYHLNADKNNLYDVLMNIINSNDQYQSFDITDYINNDYFTLNSVDDIKVSIGNVNVETENGNQKVIWNLGDNFTAGSKAEMDIDISLNEEYKNSDGLFPTNKNIAINYQMQGYYFLDNYIIPPVETVESDDTTVLSHSYNLDFDLNLPNDCLISNLPTENHNVFTLVDLDSKTQSCNGYNFRGWDLFKKEGYNDGTKKKISTINNNSFIMPSEDVVAVAKWSKTTISKSSSGTIESSIYEEPYLSNFVSPTVENEENDISEVVFGNICWQTIGKNSNEGIKLIYDGIPDSDGKCGNNNVTHPAYGSMTNVDLSNNYAYGTSYDYNYTNDKFYLTGTTENYTINDDNYNNLIGKYTCMQNDENKGCNQLYFIYSYDNATSVNVIPLSSSNIYYSIGISKFNENSASPAKIGYMYDNKNFEIKNKKMDLINFEILLKNSMNNDIYIDDSFSYIDDNYKLDNPKTISSVSNYDELTGKYTFLSNDSNYENDELYYIVKADKNYIYYLQLYDGLDENSAIKNYAYGDTVSSNGDGTYTISGNSEISNINWITNNLNLVDKYICSSGSSTCAHPFYIIDTDSSSFEYIMTYKFGNSFTYDTNTHLYTLVDDIDQYQWTTNTEYYNSEGYYNTAKLDNDSQTKHHYTCFNDTGVCQNIKYLFSKNVTNVDYYELENGLSMKDEIDNLFDGLNSNNSNSIIKTVVDSWFKENLNDYLDYIDDTLFCSNRNIINYGKFDKDKGFTNEDIVFDSGECTDINDIYSVSNSDGNGKLTYPVGIFNYTKSGKNSWIGTSTFKYINSNGIIDTGSSDLQLGVRPVISLKNNVEILQGNGTKSKPYLIKY